MATTQVSITFEADSKDDAEAKVQEWNLHEGCVVNINFVSSTFGMINAEGELVAPEVPAEMMPESPDPAGDG